jgi:hypothetical protein
LETYIRDFDILWNRVEIDERYVLIFFLGGLDIEIKIWLRCSNQNPLSKLITYPVYKKIVTSTRNSKNNQSNTRPYLLATTEHPNNNLFTNIITFIIYLHNPLDCLDYYPPLKLSLVLNLLKDLPELLEA